MSDYPNRYTPPSSSSQSYAPSAPPAFSDSYHHQQQQHQASYGNQYQYPQQQQQQQPPYGGGGSNINSYSSSSSPPSYGGGHSASSGFPPGTHPDVIRSFQMVDRDGSGFIDEKELQQALSSGYQRFHIRTVRLLMFLYKNPYDASRMGPKEFAALWSCLGQWRGIFERYDRDRSGKIDLFELRDALFGLGFAIPSSVLQVLIAKYDDGSSRKIELNFDSFVECGMIIKGLTDKFKEKDTRYTGSAKFNYDEFMSMVIPFLVSYD